MLNVNLINKFDEKILNFSQKSINKMLLIYFFLYKHVAETLWKKKHENITKFLQTKLNVNIINKFYQKVLKILIKINKQNVAETFFSLETSSKSL